jgi:hypothetical protein
MRQKIVKQYRRELRRLFTAPVKDKRDEVKEPRKSDRVFKTARALRKIDRTLPVKQLGVSRIQAAIYVFNQQRAK